MLKIKGPLDSVEPIWLRRLIVCILTPFVFLVLLIITSVVNLIPSIIIPVNATKEFIEETW